MMELVLVYGLVFARLVSFWTMLPFIGESSLMPTFARGALSLSLLPFVYSWETAQTVHLVFDSHYAILLAKEVALGFFLGFLVSLPLRVPEMMGDLIDQQRGATVTDKYNMMTGQESSYIGQLLMFTVFAYFLSEGGLNFLIRVIGGTFALQDPTSFAFGFGNGVKDIYLTMFGDFMRLFAILSMPVVLAMLMAELALGLAARSATTLNAFQYAQPVKALLAVGVCILIQPKMVSALMSWMNVLGYEIGDI